MKNEFELIKSAQNGDHIAFEELVYSVDKQILSLALRYTRDEDEAKDIYQEVFIKAYRHLGKFKFESSFSTWIYRITVNTCLTHQSRKRKNMYSIDEHIDEERLESLEKDKNLQSNDTPSEYAQNKETMQIIKSKLEKLAPKQKIVFTMKHLEGFKIREIAQAMQCKEGTVKKYLFEAVHFLKKELQPYNIY